MDKSRKRFARIKWLVEQLSTYFGPVLDPTLRMRLRIFSGLIGLAALIALGVIIICVYIVVLIPFTPSIADLQKAKIDQPSMLISSDGKRLATYKPMNREWVRLNRVSPHVIGL